jgi:uncharacterized integral membrane protein
MTRHDEHGVVGERQRSARLHQLADVAEAGTRSHVGILAFVAGVVVAASAAVLVVQNTSSAAIEWFWFDLQLPLWLVLAASFLAGLIVAPLLHVATKQVRHRREEKLRLIADARRP